MENKRKLTEKQKRFIDYYVELGNATEAAKRAGYSERSAKQIGNENLTKLDFFIKERLKELEDKQIAKAEEVLKYLTRVMRGEEKEIFVETGKDGEEITIEGPPAIRERTKAAELLGKRYLMFTDRVEHSGVVGGEVIITIDGEDYGD